MKKTKMTKAKEWKMMSRGEKVLGVVLAVIKFVLIAVVVVASAGLVIAVGLGLVIASCIASALSGGFNYVGRDETFVRFR